MAESNATIYNDLKGDALVRSVLDNKELMAEAIEGFQQIDDGNNTVVTLEQIQESLANDQPIV